MSDPVPAELDSPSAGPRPSDTGSSLSESALPVAAAVIGVSVAQVPRVVDGPPENPDSAVPLADTAVAAERVVDRAPSAANSLWLEPGESGPMVSLAFNLQKLPGQGEDADPILRQGTDVAAIGVLDGMGGAGGTVYQTPDGPRTGAYLGSRAARQAAEALVISGVSPDGELDGPALADALHGALTNALSVRLSELHAPRSGLRSRLLRSLPTTMALALLRRPDHGSTTWHCHLFWAGDSRVYLLTAGSGAQQLTVDDIRDRGDAMANLREDSVVSNAVSADTPFTVSYRRIALEEPFLLLAATDGCFGYLPSPMHFERLVVDALCRAEDPSEWSSCMQSMITAVAGDDAAMALIGVGADHELFREMFAPRLRELDEKFVGPLDAESDAVRRAEQELAAANDRQLQRAASLWAEYKTRYAGYLQEQPVSATAEMDRS